MSDTVELVQVAHSVTATRNHLKKTIDYANTAELSAYTGKKGELIFNTDNRAINYLNGVIPGGFLPAAALPVANSTTLPTASLSNRGHLYTLASSVANTADSIVVSILTTSNSTVSTYAWKTVTI
jgi:hypothetical protein